MTITSAAATESPTASKVDLRRFAMCDCGEAVAFRSTIEGLGLDESDTPAAIDAFLIRNPAFSAVASIDGRLVGTVLCGHNGRAGSLHHLAVDAAFRRRGIGRELVSYCFSRLAAADISRCNIFVYSDNDAGNRFWIRSGWNDPKTWKVLQKRVEEKSNASGHPTRRTLDTRCS